MHEFTMGAFFGGALVVAMWMLVDVVLEAMIPGIMCPKCDCINNGKNVCCCSCGSQLQEDYRE